MISLPTKYSQIKSGRRNVCEYPVNAQAAIKEPAIFNFSASHVADGIITSDPFVILALQFGVDVNTPHLSSINSSAICETASLIGPPASIAPSPANSTANISSACLSFVPSLTCSTSCLNIVPLSKLFVNLGVIYLLNVTRWLSQESKRLFSRKLSTSAFLTSSSGRSQYGRTFVLLISNDLI